MSSDKHAPCCGHPSHEPGECCYFHATGEPGSIARCDCGCEVCAAELCTCGHTREHHDPDDGCGACAMAMRSFRHDFRSA